MTDIPARGEMATRLRECGVAGAGGAGFPTYVKWQNLNEIENLLVNLQEGEPPFYGDCWLISSQVDFYLKGLSKLAAVVFDSVVVATKEKYREKWFKELEKLLAESVYFPTALPLEVEDRQGLILAYTGDRYEISQESSLLWTVAGERVGGDLPTNHGWIVQNAETTYNILLALLEGRPVTRKHVLLYGPDQPARYFVVPIGTPVFELLDAVEKMSLNNLKEPVLLDGGPGWCCEVERSFSDSVVSKRTNGLMIAGRDFVEEYREKREPERINALSAGDWFPPEDFPEPRQLEPDKVRVPLISNPLLEEVVTPSRPVVEPGNRVKRGDVVAEPASEGISNYQHASISGGVTAVDENFVTIEK